MRARISLPNAQEPASRVLIPILVPRFSYGYLDTEKEFLFLNLFCTDTSLPSRKVTTREGNGKKSTLPGTGLNEFRGYYSLLSDVLSQLSGKVGRRSCEDESGIFQRSFFIQGS